MQFRLSWLFALIFAGAMASVYLSNHVFVQERAVSTFSPVDGMSTIGGFVDVSNKSSDRLIFRYNRLSNSGVEIERIIDGQIQWMVFAEPTDKNYFSFTQNVDVSIEGDAFHIRSRGAHTSQSGANFSETRNLADGKLISRKL